MKVLLVILVGLVIFFAGCVKEKPKELQFKDDVVTVENYFVSNVAPYEKGETSIQFEIHNNGDRKIPYLEIDFFDIPGFEIISGSLECPIGKRIDENKCRFSKKTAEVLEPAFDQALEPLDVRSITVRLKPTENVDTPTPHTVSFAIRYVYFGTREASIPVIDGTTKKEPTTKFRQSGPSTGPVVIDIEPSLERTVEVGGETVKQYWGRTGSPFTTKFKFSHVGSVGKTKDVNISENNVRIKLSNLENNPQCGFISEGSKNFNIKMPLPSSQYNFEKLDLAEYTLISQKPVVVPHDTLLCTFKPTSSFNVPEYTGTISAIFAYKYEFIKSQNFVVQPLPE